MWKRDNELWYVGLRHANEKARCLTACSHRSFDNDGVTLVTQKEETGSLFVGGIGDKDWAKDGKRLSRNYPQGNRVYSEEGKSVSLSANGGGLGGPSGLYAVDAEDEYIIRKLTP